jgi:hypothetical protein
MDPGGDAAGLSAIAATTSPAELRGRAELHDDGHWLAAGGAGIGAVAASGGPLNCLNQGTPLGAPCSC